MKNNLLVAETFYSIQGEGTSAGCPSVFLRLAGCNLLCQSDTWICDTIEVWRKGTFKKFEDVLSAGQINALQNGAHLVITGGEPMLQQHKILDFLDWLSETYFQLEETYNRLPYIEVETNGTIEPCELMLHTIDQWNVSFKLSNSGEPYSKRINEVALMKFNSLLNAHFKLVVSKTEDVLEVLTDLPELNFRKVILMPAGATRQELEETRPVVVELCKQFGLRYTDRQHIVIWDKKTGV